MDSASIQFVMFGLAAAVVSNLSRSPVWRSAVLLIASLVFLALLAPHPLALVPLLGFLALGYAGLVLIHSGRRSSLTSLSVLAVVLAYVWLKKYTFLPDAVFLRFPYFTVGLSYIFFRVLHLLIEAGDVGPAAYLIYTLNFTSFAAGPIQRYDEFARDQFAAEPIPLGPRVIGRQLERIVIGFFKVNVLAVLLHAVQQDALAQMAHWYPLQLRLFAACRLAAVYPFFLYANFSGYIDIVIALARLMRVRLPENFDRPFSASSFLDFWNRWHITLSTWLKTYVYNPLLVGLMRQNLSPALDPFFAVLCFFVTFFLIGVWHGRTSEFVIFGVLQGGGVAANKLWQIAMTRALGRKGYKALANDSAYTSAGRGMTFSWFALTLFWFWAGWEQLDRVFTALSPAWWAAVWLAIWFGATVILEAWERLRLVILSIRIAGEPVLTHRYARTVYTAALVVGAFVMTVLLNQPAPDIVYKGF